VSFVLAVSDTHGNLPALAAVLNWARARGDLEAAVFLGDGLEDLERASAAAGFAVPWYKVRGNLDPPDAPETLTLETGGRRLFLAHGNRHHVETSPRELAAAARAAGAEAALFGHTHVPFRGMACDNIFLLNPGSAGRPRSDAGATFAVLEVSPSAPFRAVFYCLAGQGRRPEIRELNL
jgi:putative phosphoesterase